MTITNMRGSSHGARPGALPTIARELGFSPPTREEPIVSRQPPVSYKFTVQMNSGDKNLPKWSKGGLGPEVAYWYYYTENDNSWQRGTWGLQFTSASASPAPKGNGDPVTPLVLGYLGSLSVTPRSWSLRRPVAVRSGVPVSLCGPGQARGMRSPPAWPT